MAGDFVVTFYVPLSLANGNVQFLCWSRLTLGFKNCIVRRVGRLSPGGDFYLYFFPIFCSVLEDTRRSIKMVITDCFRNSDRNLLTLLY